MKAIVAAALASLLMASTPNASMADGLVSSSTRDRSATCFLLRRSPILNMSSVSDMRAAVEQRYERSVDVSIARRTIYSRRAVFAWASETKVACGKAIGYFKGREVNVVMISKCDCYHGRMVAHLR